MSPVIHLNTAGAGLPDPAVYRAVSECLEREARCGPYETEAYYAELLDSVIYQRLARLVGANPEDIALFGSATEAWCRVVCDLELSAGSLIWVTPYEYAGNLIALQRLAARTGAEIRIMPTLPDGTLDLERARAELDERVALVSVVHMPSGVGVVQPVEEIGALLAGSSAIYAVDACQTVGQLDLDVRRIGCDLLTGAGRKFLCGPRGTGFGYISERLRARIVPRFYDLHAARVESLTGHRVSADGAVRFETAERNNAVVLGLLAATELALDRPRAAAPEVFAALLAAVRETPGVRPLTPGGELAGIVSFVHERMPADAIRDQLAKDGINGWVGVAEHTPLYLGELGLDRFVRISVHHYNSVTDIEAFHRSLRSAVAA